MNIVNKFTFKFYYIITLLSLTVLCNPHQPYQLKISKLLIEHLQPNFELKMSTSTILALKLSNTGLTISTIMLKWPYFIPKCGWKFQRWQPWPTHLEYGSALFYSYSSSGKIAILFVDSYLDVCRRKPF